MAEDIKDFIKKESYKIYANNPFFEAVRCGTLKQASFRQYLRNLEYVFQQTPIMLELAEKKSVDLGFKELAIFMREKIEEEKGHDAWARNDLNKSGTEIVKPNVQESTKNVIAFTKKIINEDPRLYLGYMLFVEYFTVLLGPLFLKQLEENCGITPGHVTAIGNHEETDRGHVLEDLAMISSFIEDESVKQRFFAILAQSSVLVNRSLAECLEI